MSDDEEKSSKHTKYLAHLHPDELEIMPDTKVVVKNATVKILGVGASLSLGDVAAATANIFEPNKSAEVSRVGKLLGEMDTPSLKLMDKGVMDGNEAGFETTLEPVMVQMLAEANIGDRQLAETRAHEIELATIQARGPIWVEVVKFAIAIVGTFLVTYLGFVKP
jgi:hypothetical protein